jgi:hypothetical protein
MQFIPRAFVFVTIVGLYSFLFNFLRRPDTIQLSSSFGAGGTSNGGGGIQMGRVLKRFGGGKDDKTGANKRNAPVNPDAPWEQMEFVQVGGREWALTPLASPETSPASKLVDAPLPQEQSRPGTPEWQERASHGTSERDQKSSTSLLRESTSSSEQATPTGPHSQRPSESETLVTPESKYEEERPKASLSPIPADTATSKSELSYHQVDEESEDDAEDGKINLSAEKHLTAPRRPSGQSLTEFFQEHQASGLGAREEGRGHGTETNGKVQVSAATYFNRQASLLMLYFPLAVSCSSLPLPFCPKHLLTRQYMAVFSVSLIRLIYAMVHKQPSPVLTVISSWMVLSVGLMDALVYGLAEFIVRRRVRRKMPDRL